MPNLPLSDSRIRALKPRPSTYDLRDSRLRGFGVRVLPSGAKRFFLHAQHRGERVWQIVGDANALPLAEARARAASRLAAIRRGAETPEGPRYARFEAVAEAVFARHASVWKPRTLEVNRSYLRRQILPGFRGRPVAEITAQDVRRWFASLRATPVAADRSLPVLSVIMREAELMGARPEGTNPCRGIRRYRRKGRERFLTDEEIARLGERLSAHEVERPLEVAAVRLLMLTGCRKSEVATLRWSDYREGHLFLRDSKTGPRTVWLSHAARAVLDGVPARADLGVPLSGGAMRHRSGTGRNASGNGCVPRQSCTGYVCTTSGTPMPHSRCAAARACSPSAGSSGTPTRRPHSSTPISPTPWCTKRPRPWARWWRVEP